MVAVQHYLEVILERKCVAEVYMKIPSLARVAKLFFNIPQIALRTHSSYTYSCNSMSQYLEKKRKRNEVTFHVSSSVILW
jgi:hypothetical protein